MDRHLDKITVYALPAIVQNKRKKEQIVEEITKPIYEDLIRRIKESDDWFTLIYSKEKNTLKVREMQHVVYKLHKHPNIISKLMMTDPSGKHPLAVKMRPFAFKWVNESEKKELGLKAVATKDLSDEDKNLISSLIDITTMDAVDILNVLGVLFSQEADKKWIKLEAMEIAARCLQPIDFTFDVLNLLQDHKVLKVFKHAVPSKTSIANYYIAKLTLTEEEYEKASEEINTENVSVIFQEIIESKAKEHKSNREKNLKKIIDISSRIKAQDNKVIEDEPVISKLHNDDSNVKVSSSESMNNLFDNLRSIIDSMESYNLNETNKYAEKIAALSEDNKRISEDVEKSKFVIDTLQNNKDDYQKENNKLKEENEKLCEQLKSLRRCNDAYKRHEEKLREFVCRKVQVLMRNSMIALSKYMTAPAHVRVDEEEQALAMQCIVTEPITKLLDDINSFKVESDYPDKLYK